MVDLAAQLVDRVFPASVPVRQWVLSAPRELRVLLARDPHVLSQLLRVFRDEVERGDLARVSTELPGVRRGAAVSMIQRFSGSLGLNVHDHSAWVDGIYVVPPGDAPPTFVAAPPPLAADTARRGSDCTGPRASLHCYLRILGGDSQRRRRPDYRVRRDHLRLHIRRCSVHDANHDHPGEAREKPGIPGGRGLTFQRSLARAPTRAGEGRGSRSYPCSRAVLPPCCYLHDGRAVWRGQRATLPKSSKVGQRSCDAGR